MKLLLFSDLHRNKDAATKLVEISRGVDVMIGAGDFATCRNGIHDCIDILKTADCPAVLVAGNAESAEELAVGGLSGRVHFGFAFTAIWHRR
jgi:predicted phosphodiesterase